MNSEIKKLLEGVRDGSVSVDEALLKIKTKQKSLPNFSLRHLRRCNKWKKTA